MVLLVADFWVLPQLSSLKKKKKEPDIAILAVNTQTHVEHALTPNEGQ
jgi:hypothetical protein